jgi:hypothetical protein
MAKYISLIKYTAKGIENVKESPSRLDAFKQLCESMAVTVDGFYLTMGRYDLMVIVDAPGGRTYRNAPCFYGGRISQNYLRITIAAMRFVHICMPACPMECGVYFMGAKPIHRDDLNYRSPTLP